MKMQAYSKGYEGWTGYFHRFLGKNPGLKEFLAARKMKKDKPVPPGVIDHTKAHSNIPKDVQKPPLQQFALHQNNNGISIRPLFPDKVAKEINKFSAPM